MSRTKKFIVKLRLFIRDLFQISSEDSGERFDFDEETGVRVGHYDYDEDEGCGIIGAISSFDFL